MTSRLEIENLVAGYADLQVLNQVSFSLQPGEIGCLLGPSGCGKTTVLRVIAGFENAWQGKVEIDGIEVSSGRYSLPPEKRAAALAEMARDLPPHYREVIEEYFRQLARESGK